MSFIAHLVIGSVTAALLVSLLYAAEYPMTTIKCFSSLTSPDNQVICPEARSNYCVKEISSLTENLCGKTQYFGDVYVNSLCEFKKCADSCSEETITFEFEGNEYSRQRFCCKNDYCNSAAVTTASTLMTMLISIGLGLYLVM